MVYALYMYIHGKKEFVSGVVVLYCVALYVVLFDHVHCMYSTYIHVHVCVFKQMYVHVYRGIY